jgi:hypothetical protein
MSAGHDEVDELLGAYALDAVSSEEKKLVEDHVRTCPRCRAEVEEHRETVATFARIEAAPEGLWNRIAGSLETAPPDLRLAPVASARRQNLFRLGAAAGVAAALLAAFLGYRVIDLDRRLNAFATDQALEHAAMRAQTDPKSDHVQLQSTQGSAVVGNLALEPDGDGYLVVNELKELSSGYVYQLWSLRRRTDHDPLRISLALLGTNPRVAAFRASAPVDGFAITEESGSGSETTSKQPTAIGWIKK